MAKAVKDKFFSLGRKMPIGRKIKMFQILFKNPQNVEEYIKALGKFKKRKLQLFFPLQAKYSFLSLWLFIIKGFSFQFKSENKQVFSFNCDKLGLHCTYKWKDIEWFFHILYNDFI